MASDSLRSYHSAAYRHAYNDGIAEILVSLLLVMTAFAIRHQPVGNVVVLGTAVLLAWALRRLRDRITTPRVGSAVLPQEPGREVGGMAIYVAIVGAVIIVSKFATEGGSALLAGYRWVPVFTALCLSGGFLYVVQRAHLKRFYVYLLADLVLGVLSPLTMASGQRAEAYATTASLLLVLAAIVLVGGVVTLIVFVRHNPVFHHHAEVGGVHGR